MSPRSLGCLFELLETALLTAVIFLVAQAYVVQPYQVQQPSMENTLLPDQYVLVDKLTPHFDDYHRGDIIVFNPPPGWSQDVNGTPFIKRVIGQPGDSVDVHDGKVYVNGKQVTEPYVFEGQTTDTTDGRAKSWTVGSDQLFVMGDHRQSSQDSRDFGPIEKASVIGRAWVRYWPISAVGLIPSAKQSPAPNGSTAPSGSPVPSKAP